MKYIPRILLILLFLTLPRLVWAEEDTAAGGNGETPTAQTDPDTEQKKADGKKKKAADEEEEEEEEEPDCD
jgi:hypothetical protein